MVVMDEGSERSAIPIILDVAHISKTPDDKVGVADIDKIHGWRKDMSKRDLVIPSDECKNETIGKFVKNSDMFTEGIDSVYGEEGADVFAFFDHADKEPEKPVMMVIVRTDCYDEGFGLKPTLSRILSTWIKLDDKKAKDMIEDMKESSGTDFDDVHDRFFEYVVDNGIDLTKKKGRKEAYKWIVKELFPEDSVVEQALMVKVLKDDECANELLASLGEIAMKRGESS